MHYSPSRPKTVTGKHHRAQERSNERSPLRVACTCYVSVRLKCTQSHGWAIRVQRHSSEIHREPEIRKEKRSQNVEQEINNDQRGSPCRLSLVEDAMSTLRVATSLSLSLLLVYLFFWLSCLCLSVSRSSFVTLSLSRLSRCVCMRMRVCLSRNECTSMRTY